MTDASAKHTPEVPHQSDPRPVVRFALAEMSARNEHHGFEHLCRALARQRIMPNILPATGPVAAGGDQGRDFESFLTYLHNRTGDVGVFLGLDDDDTVVFCCTLQAEGLADKIGRDVETVCSSGTVVDAIVYFCQRDLPVAHRHRLIDEARANWSIRLEIIDGQAISELLSERSSFWIAAQYLSIPMTLAPGSPSDQPEWYARNRAKWSTRTSTPSTFGDFIELAGCLDFAVRAGVTRDDIELWIVLLETFLPDSDRRLRQRARYEIVIARLRGQGDMRPADDLFRAFFDEVITEPTLSELAPASVLLSYGQGAWLHAQTDVSVRELEDFGTKLEVAARDASDGNHAEQVVVALDALARLRLRLNLDAMQAAGVEPTVGEAPPLMSDDEWKDVVARNDLRIRTDLVHFDAGGALVAWMQLLSLLPSASLFPVGDLADAVALWAPVLSDLPGWRQFTRDLDRRVSAMSSAIGMARVALDRGASLRAGGRALEGLAELQRARMAFVDAGNSQAVVSTLLDAAYLYIEFGLLYAAKHHALAAGALGASVEENLSSTADSLILTAHCDFLAGNWWSFLSLLPHAVRAHFELRESAWDMERWDDFIILMHEGLLVGHAAGLYSDSVLSACAQQHMDKAGLSELLAQLGDDFASATGIDSWDGVIALAADQLGQAPFGDGGDRRTIQFAARGVRWRLATDNNYDDVRAAERLAAAIQVLMASLSDRDLVPIEVVLHVDLETEAPGTDTSLPRTELEGRTTDDALHWNVALTRDAGPYSIDYKVAIRESLIVVVTMLRSVSLLPDDAFEALVGNVLENEDFRAGLVPHIRYDRAYAVLPEDAFDPMCRKHLPLADEAMFGEVMTGEHLGPIRTPGPTFRDEEPQERVAGRYVSWTGLLSNTLPRLLCDEGFNAVVRSARELGWRDWHILQAVGNQVLNHEVQTRGEEVDPEKLRDLGSGTNPLETPSSSPLPASDVSIDSLRLYLEVSFAATIDALGLVLPPFVTRAELAHILTTRYLYWELDIEHPDPFKPP